MVVGFLAIVDDEQDCLNDLFGMAVDVLDV
jgi:hypothetical protein